MASRTKNTKRNIIASYMLMVIQTIFQFVSRTVIVHTLGEEYLGLSSLFTSVLQVLNIAELGFSSSIVFFMYKPLAEKDESKVCALLAYLKKIYKIVGIIIFGVGIIITPFITIIIKGTVPKDINVYILYVLYLINTSISYFLFAYKTALLTALQRLDLTKIANCIVIFIQYLMQLVALVIFHNYYLFGIAMICGTALVNIFTAFICDKKFPEFSSKGELDSSIKRDIVSKVKGLMICNISSVTYTSLDSIIISTFIGLSSVAIYNNYIMIYNAVSSFVTLIRTAMQASIGNSIAKEPVEKNYKDMLLWQFLFSLISTWCVTCMVCLFQPFMEIWMGRNLLLPIIDVFFIGIWFMISSVQHAFYLYLTGNGLWNEMKWPYIFSTCLNLIMNIVLGNLMGTTGIILASLLSCLISGTFWQCNIIFKHYFGKSAKQYIDRQFLFFVLAAIIVLITYYLCCFVSMSGMVGLAVKFIICITVPAMLIYLVFRKSKLLADSKALFLRILHQ